MKHKGFTLIEFVVIISIFAIMASIALFNFAGFRSNVSLNNLSHDIALTLRQAQVFGWATQTAELNAVGDATRYANGVFFKYDGNSYAKEFKLYTKGDQTPGSEYYFDDSSTTDQTIDTINIQGPNHISDIRTAANPQELEIDPVTQLIAGGQTVGTDVSIAFSRPRPEAMFFSNTNPLTTNITDYVGIYIVADATCPLGSVCTKADHVITISRFGEITVK
jgi:prepilin-type N-terminal cleavage/methylation domain-containing protein